MGMGPAGALHPPCVVATTPHTRAPGLFQTPKTLPQAPNPAGTLPTAPALLLGYFLVRFLPCKLLPGGLPPYLLLAVKLAASSTAASFFLMPAAGSAPPELDGAGRARG